jgi:hypothetical protein
MRRQRLQHDGREQQACRTRRPAQGLAINRSVGFSAPRRSCWSGRCVTAHIQPIRRLIPRLRDIADHLPQTSTTRANEQLLDPAIDQCNPGRGSGTKNTAADSPKCCCYEIGEQTARQPLRRAIRWLDMLPDAVHCIDPELRSLSGTRARAESKEYAWSAEMLRLFHCLSIIGVELIDNQLDRAQGCYGCQQGLKLRAITSDDLSKHV